MSQSTQDSTIESTTSVARSKTSELSAISQADMLDLLGLPVKNANDSIVYSNAQIQKAKNQGMVLVSPIAGVTMHDIVLNLDGQMPNGQPIFITGADWFSGKMFYREIKTSSSPYFVSQSPLEESNKKDYFEQTLMLADWVNENIGLSSNLSKTKGYIDNFRQQEKQLKKICLEDPKRGTQMLNQLGLNRNCRELGVELLLRVATMNKKGVFVIENGKCTWAGDVSHMPGEVIMIGLNDKGLSFTLAKADAKYNETFLFPKIQ